MFYHIYKFHPNDKRTVHTVLEMAKDPDVYLGFIKPRTSEDDMLDAGSIDLFVRYPAAKRGKWGDLYINLSWYDSDSYEWEPGEYDRFVSDNVAEHLRRILSFSFQLEGMKEWYIKNEAMLRTKDQKR